MRSAFAVFLRGFVLPFGATSGRRIVFDGVAGEIRFYDSNNALRIRIGLPAGTIELYSGQTSESLAGNVQATAVGSGGSATRRIGLVVETGSFSGRTPASVMLTSESFDGTVNAVAQVSATSFDLDSPEAAVKPEYRVEGKTIGRGVIAQFVDTTNDGPHTADTVTDMVLNNVSQIADHVYSAHLHTRVTNSAAGARWDLECRRNGTVIGRFGLVDTNILQDIDGTVWWTATATGGTDDFDVFANEISGASDLTLTASATVPRQLTIVDHGKL